MLNRWSWENRWEHSVLYSLGDRFMLKENFCNKLNIGMYWCVSIHDAYSYIRGQDRAAVLFDIIPLVWKAQHSSTPESATLTFNYNTAFFASRDRQTVQKLTTFRCGKRTLIWLLITCKDCVTSANFPWGVKGPWKIQWKSLSWETF